MDSFEPPPILCAAQLRKVDGKLLELLDSLRAEEWQLPTLAPGWTVGDVAGHLLDTALRKLSMVRDHWIVEQPEIRSARDLAVFVNRMNHEGVAVYRRLSPAVLISWLRAACRASAEFHESLDPFAPAAFAVSWAGEDRSLNWFDTARELTERWHHQQQIRHATGRPGIMTPELYHPVLDCFLRGLPYAWRDVAAPEGTCVADRDRGRLRRHLATAEGSGGLEIRRSFRRLRGAHRDSARDRMARLHPGNRACRGGAASPHGRRSRSRAARSGPDGDRGVRLHRTARGVAQFWRAVPVFSLLDGLDGARRRDLAARTGGRPPGAN